MNAVGGRVDLDLGQVVLEHRPRIYRYVLSMARDPEVAEDLTQETFLRALRGLGSLRDRAALVPWLYRLATNVFIDWVRAEGRRRLAYTGRQDRDEAELVGEIPDPAARVDRRVEQSEMSECVQGFVDDLPDDFRSVILLHDAHGLSNREIAQMLGLTVATTKIRIHRGRLRLRQALEAGCTFEPDDRGVTVCDPVSAVQPDERRHRIGLATST
ncbi:MAG TPA: RNA polymerase sigma factor [Propionibacteriaceae bacterium]|nr:RNA polymerase sigma factor [Propionibacteriaceae bacterium]